MVDGQVVCEDYRPGGGATVPQEIWSGTKSFSAIMAAAAIEDGIISSWDELLVDTIPEWIDDPRKSQVSLAQLLSLTSGIEADNDPNYADSILAPALYDPGTFWEYGSVPYQIFGEFLRRKNDPTWIDPLAYLQDRVLTPIGASYDGWNRGDDDMPLLAWGSQWVAPEWIKYGELIRNGGYWPASGEQVVDQELLDEVFHRSAVKDDYGRTWWLPLPGSTALPCDTAMAIGLGTQYLYVIRSQKMVVVRQTDDFWDGLNFDNTVLIDRLLDPSEPQDDCPPGNAAGLLLSRDGIDLTFDWNPVNQDITGNTDLIQGYELYSAQNADFSDAMPLSVTAGPRSVTVVPGEGIGGSDLTFYQVRALDVCGNPGSMD